MRAVVHCSLALVSFAAMLSSRAIQPTEEAIQPPDNIEGVIVRGGKTLSPWRLEVYEAQDGLFKLFNELNVGVDNDLRCRDEAPTGTRIPQRACWSHAQERAGAAGARMFLNELLLSGKRGNADRAIAQATSSATRDARSAEDRFKDEWERVLGGDQQFAEAVAEYAELKAEFDRLRGVTSAPVQQLRQILLGPAGPQCEAGILTEFEQRNNVARVSGTISISMCPAGTTGTFTLVAQVRDDAGETRPIAFMETWQRTDAQDHIFHSDYPIGENVFLQSVRVRSLTCTCESPTQ
jgi:hypothetical protein